MKETSSRGKSGMGGGKKSSKKSGKKPHSMHIKRAHSGGFVVTHHHLPDETGAMQEPEDHVVGSLDDLQSHVAQNMADQPPAESMPPPQAQQQQQAPPQGM